MTQVTTSSNAGFFGYIGATGTVKNVKITNGTITQNGTGTTSAGGIAGQNEGTIENCSFSGTISGRNSVGGIAGYNQGKIQYSYNTGTVSGNQQVGGIAGTNTGSGNLISNCYNTGNVSSTATSASNTGGIVGINQSTARVEICYNTGNVSSTNTTVGGIVGNNSGTGTNVADCISLGAKVTGTGSVGRVAGVNTGTLSNDARKDQKIGASGSEAIVTQSSIIGSVQINGADKDVTWMVTSIFTSKWSTDIWNKGTGNVNSGPLPTLITNTQSPAPTLPAAP